MTTATSHNEAIAIQVCETLSSTLSIISLVLALRKIVSHNIMYSSSSSSSWKDRLRLPRITEDNMIDMLLGVLFIILLVLAFFQGIGLAAVNNYNMCAFQGIIFIL